MLLIPLIISTAVMIACVKHLKTLFNQIKVYEELTKVEVLVVKNKERSIKRNPPITMELIDQLEIMGVIVDEKLKY